MYAMSVCIQCIEDRWNHPYPSQTSELSQQKTSRAHHTTRDGTFLCDELDYNFGGLGSL